MAEHVHDLNKRIQRNFILYFLLIIILFGITLILINRQILSTQERDSEKQITVSADAFKAIFAEKFGVVASSDIFLEYLHAGNQTRTHIFPDFLLQVSALKSPVIAGMVIQDRNGRVIFTDGKKTDTFLNLNICYLNARLDNKFGECQYQWLLYIDSQKYLNEFSQFTPEIIPCQKCQPIDLLKGKSFGPFEVAESTPLLVKLMVENRTTNDILKYFLLVSVILIICYFLLKQHIRRIFLNFIEVPLKQITSAIKQDDFNQPVYPLIELQYLSEQLLSWKKRHQEAEILKREAALGQIATQVAHDIRSPLLVLKRILNDLPSLPEKKRIDTRNAMQRVTDIANNLLSQYKQDKNYNDLELNLSSEPVAIMLESIVSEKRIQVADLGVEITLEVLPNAYDAFVQVDIAGFKRALSNLMNNAIEAVKDKEGRVTLALRKSDSSIVIDIKDNGCGIPKDKLLSVLEEGVSFGKKEGSGLGLPYAVSKISEWHGDYSLTSEPGEGTQFEIILPECKSGEWFRSEIVIEKNGTIVILDDDDYIHQIWDERFPIDFLQKHQLEIFHFNNPHSFVKFCQGKTFNKTIFLLDYELGKYQETGLTLAKMLNIGQYATLVTSRYEDEDVRENCKKLGMKIIPKSFAELTPIRVFEPTEIIFIDDEEIIGEFWKDSAESAGKTISVFQDPRDFMRIVHLYPKDALIYIDSSLGNGLKGEDFAKQLYEMGYQNIFLATGFSKDHFKDVTWIKDVIGKEPPWR
ncbi:MAG: sensor histidine kinase [Gammaproteobacteria bacterium]|jgi:signal transduction histidine kinase|nr:sensor histidine kinase [Gammaproteobacteria bacterium]